MKQLIPTESQEQASLFQWAETMLYRYPELALMYHIPNGGSRNKIEAARLKAQGVKPGVPDICLPVARKGYHGLYIELKRRGGGKVSDEQKEWIKALTEQEYTVVVCEGWDVARAAIEHYLREATP